MNPARRTSLVVTLAGTAAFVGLAAVLVPWSPVPGGMPDPVPASSVFDADHLRRAEAFARWSRAWGWASLVVSLALACWLGFGRWGGRLVGRLPGPWWLQVVLAVTALAVAGRVLTLPFALLQHRHHVTHGLSTQSTRAFLADVARAEGVGIVVSAGVLVLLVGCARVLPRAWPAVAGAGLGALVLAGSFVYPVLVEPVFHSFTPLPAGSLRTGILELAQREGVDVDGVLVADASRRTTTMNAYVSGLGSTRRVVVYDNLVDGLPEDQALSVVAHELAHARHHDVLTGSVLGAVGVLTAVGGLGLVLTRRRSSVSVADPRAVPLVLALVALGTLATSPVQNGISRQVEIRADVDALRATGDPDAFVAMQRQLALRSLADPTPPAWAQLWFGSHPTLLQRIALAQEASGVGGGPSG